MFQVQTMLLGEGQSDCVLGPQVVADRCKRSTQEKHHTLFRHVQMCSETSTS